jgi:hypothetical protein
MSLIFKKFQVPLERRESTSFLPSISHTTCNATTLLLCLRVTYQYSSLPIVYFNLSLNYNYPHLLSSSASSRQCQRWNVKVKVKEEDWFQDTSSCTSTVCAYNICCIFKYWSLKFSTLSTFSVSCSFEGENCLRISDWRRVRVSDVISGISVSPGVTTPGLLSKIHEAQKRSPRLGVLTYTRMGNASERNF